MDHHSFTEQYLAIIRDTLRVQTTDDGEKRYQWTEDTADELTRRLENHFNSFAEAAITAAREDATESMYSFHYGYSPNLSETLKYAPLYTDHVILQDIVYRTLRGSRDRPPKERHDSVMPYIQNILNWEPLIQSGHVSIVPSPHLWSSEIRSFMSEIDSDERKICSQPLWAAGRFNATPFTDSKDYCGHMTQIAMEAQQLKNSSQTGEVQDPMPLNAIRMGKRAGDHNRPVTTGAVNETLQDMDIRSVGARLFGQQHDDDQADLYYIQDATYEEIIEMAEEFEGFRIKLNDILDELAEEDDVSEFHDILEQAPEKIEADYQQVRREFTVKRDIVQGSAGVAGLAMTLPLFVQLSPADLLATTQLTSNYDLFENLLNAVVGVVGGAGGALSFREVAEQLFSKDDDFVQIMDEFEGTEIENSYVKSLTPVRSYSIS